MRERRALAFFDAEPTMAARRAGLVAGLVVVLGLALLDADVGHNRVITATVVLGPFIAALVCTTRQVAVVAAAAVAAALLSVTWTDDAWSTTHLIRIATVVLGSVIALVAAANRERTVAARQEVSAAQARFGAALDVMSAAVLIQEPGRGIVYANHAAAQAFGLPDVDGVVTSSPEEIARAWITTEEDGTPLVAERYPSRRILTGETLHPDPLIAHNVHVETGQETWMSVTATPVLDENGDVEMAVSVSEDITAIKRAEMLQGILARSGEIFAATRDQQEALQDLAALVVPELADWCAISLPADDGTIEQVAVAHRDPEKIAFAREYARRFPARVTDPAGTAAILRGEPPLMSELDDAMLAAAVDDPEQLALLRAVGMRAVILVPIVTVGGQTLGVFTLVSAESRRTFAAEDLALAAELGRRAGTALETARLYREQAEAAMVLQRSLMPAELPAIAGFAASALYRPAGTTLVGGDFYDAFRTPRGWALIVGDIAGQGVKAAALTAQARHVLRANTMLSGDLVQAVTHLNRVLCAEPVLSLCTICAVLLPDDLDSQATEILCAGHPRPILVRDGDTRELGDWGPMVGAFSDSTFTAASHALAAGDLLVLYTDGLLDARGASGRFGGERLRRVLAGVDDPVAATGAIREALADFEQGAQADDTAVVAFKRVA